VDVCRSRRGGGVDRVFDGGFSERAGGAGESGEVAAERVRKDGFLNYLL
jgi:hypothetical protein